MVVDVVAAGLHPRVRSQADGSHYTRTGELPLVPGIDGVGRGADGVRRYFILPDTTMGAMAEQTVIDARRSIVLPEDSDAIQVAAAMNPAMSSWVALRQRVDFRTGQSVLVLGATGNAGRMAVQVAKRLGAGEIIAAGRDSRRLADLAALGTTGTVSLAEDEDEVADELGRQQRRCGHRLPLGRADSRSDGRGRDGSRRPWQGAHLDRGWVRRRAGRVDSVCPSACGSTPDRRKREGSVSTREILAELPVLAQEITAGTFDIDARVMPLSDVEQAWAESAHTTQRIVITP